MNDQPFSVPLSTQHAVPPMPAHPLNETMMLGYTSAMTIISVGLFVWWYFSSERKNHGFLLPLCLLGGFLAGYMESILDILVLVWYPPSDYLVSHSAFGRDVPIYVNIGYMWFTGACCYLSYRMFSAGASTRALWNTFWIITLLDVIGISAAVFTGVIGFYGNQPFNYWGFPLYWPGVDGPQPMLGGLILFWLAPKIQAGWKRTLLCVLTPICTLGFAAGAALWPIALALNTNQSMLITHIAGAATYLIGLGLTAIAVFLYTLIRQSELPKAKQRKTVLT